MAHIQYLFDIKAIEGLLPRMNQIYVQTEQMANFLKYVYEAVPDLSYLPLAQTHTHTHTNLFLHLTLSLYLSTSM